MPIVQRINLNGIKANKSPSKIDIVYKTPAKKEKDSPNKLPPLSPPKSPDLKSPKLSVNGTNGK